MTTHALSRRAVRRHAHVRISSHWYWLLGGLAWAFVVPFVFADVLGLQRDLFYGVHAVAVSALVIAWSRSTGYDLVAAARRHLVWTVALGAAAAVVLGAVVVRTEDAAARPDGLELAAAVLWRGVVYGLADGLLLSAFPILVVFAAFAGTRLEGGVRGKLAVGMVALLASLAMTAVYHAGYGQFRSAEVTKPMRGDLVWSAPTLATLNPIGAPVAHAGMHVTAVMHSYDTDLYLPPHE